MPTVPELFALAHGLRCEGPHRCFFCGAPANDDHALSSYLRDTFTDLDLIARPGSCVICNGCVICLREACAVPLCDGATKNMTKAAMRMHSWLITSDRAVAANKSHLAWLRETCLRPPSPPWALSIADSGQKQLLYRGVVNVDAEACAVTLEGDRISYAIADLQATLADCIRIAAVCGKPALADPPSWSQRFLLHHAYGEEEGLRLVETWDHFGRSPLFRLAAFLCPKKEECDVNRLCSAGAAAI